MAFTSTVRGWWHLYRCSPGVLREEGLMGRLVYEQEILHDAVSAFEQGHLGSGYNPIEGAWTGSRRWCPNGIAGATCEADGSGCSIHNYVAAYDVEYQYNKYIRAKVTPEDFDEEWMQWVCRYQLAQVRAIEGIKNTHGEQMWKWLGWAIGDFMHWQINVPPERTEVDWNTVPGKRVELDEGVPMKIGDSGNAVAYYKRALNQWAAKFHPDWAPLKADKIFDQPMVDMVKAYQKAAQIEQTGIIPDPTDFLIGRYGIPAAGAHVHPAHQHALADHEHTGQVTVS